MNNTSFGKINSMCLHLKSINISLRPWQGYKCRTNFYLYSFEYANSNACLLEKFHAFGVDNIFDYKGRRPFQVWLRFRTDKVDFS